MINIELEGFAEFESLLKQQTEEIEEIEEIEVIIYNTVEYAKVLEYGSIPGKDPWPTPTGNKTVLRADIYDGKTKIISVAGNAMLRGNQEETKEYLLDLLSRVDLSQPIKPQIVSIMNESGSFWLENAQEDTPRGKHVAYEAWKIQKAK